MKLIKERILYFFVISVTVFFISCNKKSDIQEVSSSSGEFQWKSELKIEDIPDTPLKGFLNGKEFKIEYINFEKWRGSGDNVLNFGDVKPVNNCGFIETDNSIHLINKDGEIKTGELLKANFEQNIDGFTAYYNLAGVSNNTKTTMPWNCALVITEMNEKTVKGKIIICFKDDKKSWAAGSFEAIKCNN